MPNSIKSFKLFLKDIFLIFLRERFKIAPKIGKNQPGILNVKAELLVMYKIKTLEKLEALKTLIEDRKGFSSKKFPVGGED